MSMIYILDETVWSLKSLILSGSFFGVIFGIFARLDYIKVASDPWLGLLVCIVVIVLIGFATFSLAPEGIP